MAALKLLSDAFEFSVEEILANVALGKVEADVNGGCTCYVEGLIKRIRASLEGEEDPCESRVVERRDVTI